MKITKEQRIRLEKKAYEIIMCQKNNFTVEEIIEELKKHITIEEEENFVLEIVFNAIDYCLCEGCIDIVDSYSYMVNPVKQAELYKMENNEMLNT